MGSCLLDGYLVSALDRDDEPDGSRKTRSSLQAVSSREVETRLAGNVQLHDVHTVGCEVQEEGEAL